MEGEALAFPPEPYSQTEIAIGWLFAIMWVSPICPENQGMENTWNPTARQAVLRMATSLPENEIVRKTEALLLSDQCPKITLSNRIL